MPGTRVLVEVADAAAWTTLDGPNTRHARSLRRTVPDTSDWERAVEIARARQMCSLSRRRTEEP
jgi:hypothetical protein